MGTNNRHKQLTSIPNRKICQKTCTEDVYQYKYEGGTSGNIIDKEIHTIKIAVNKNMIAYIK